ncbi:MAG: MFS transporter, partial [Planctomycetales bacterium]|nr:MFS transporter [Planctomycetales bacterium]
MRTTSVNPVANEWRIVCLTSVGHALCHIVELAYLALLPAVMAEFALTADKAALLGVPGVVLFGVGALPSGLWADRRGPQEALQGYFGLVIAFSLLVYFSSSPVSLGIGITLLGAAISIYHPVGLAMLSRGCLNRGRAMGINGVAGSLGVATGPALGLAMATGWNWRATYLVIAALSALGLVYALVVRIEVPTVDVARAATKVDKPSPRRFAVLAIMFAAMLVGGFNYRCMITVLPSYLSRHDQRTKDSDSAIAKTIPVKTGEAGGRSAEAGTPEANAMVAMAGTATGTPTVDGNASVNASDGTPPAHPQQHGGAIVFLVFALGGVG